MRARRTAPKPIGKNPAAARHSPPDAEARERRKRLTRLLPLWPAEIEDLSIQGRARLVAVLERSLRSERRRGQAGHWTYDLARHMQLLEAYRSEMRALYAMTNTRETNRPQHPWEKPKVRSRFGTNE
jgi:hypothetical protein